MRPGLKMTLAIIAVLLAAAAGGYFLWWKSQPRLPEYIATGNGRIESDLVHASTTAGGKVMEVTVKEGDAVQQGQVLARMDTQELEAMLARSKATLASLRESIAEADAQTAERQSALTFAKQRLERAKPLSESGAIPREQADQRRSEHDAAKASLEAAQARRSTLDYSIKAAEAEVERIQTLIAETVIKAPVSGRIQHRLAEPGEVLPPGGRVVSLLDPENVYMTVFLPTEQVGKVYVGSEARIVLDAFPDYRIPATVSFVSSEAQFTPREVETQTEREKLMFRVKVRIPEELLREHAEKVRTGLPGVSYIKLGSEGDWPEWLSVNVGQ